MSLNWWSISKLVDVPTEVDEDPPSADSIQRGSDAGKSSIRSCDMAATRRSSAESTAEAEEDEEAGKSSATMETD